MNPGEQNDQRVLWIKIGVISLLTVILFLWLANLRGVFESRNNSTDKTWEKISSDMNKSFQEAESRFSDVSSSSDSAFVKDLLDKASSTVTNNNSANKTIKQELSDLIKIGTTTPKRINCPPYINCMPSIGEAKPCIIPAGCEDVTQIAY